MPKGRIFFWCLGWFFVALGAIGVVLPLLPTTPFMILAAGCFGKASPRLQAWLTNHKVFGPPIRNWNERGAISLRAKMLSLTCMCGGVGYWIYSQTPGWIAISVVITIIASCALYVWTRPNS